jgi:hypothetical protein
MVWIRGLSCARLIGASARASPALHPLAVKETAPAWGQAEAALDR